MQKEAKHKMQKIKCKKEMQKICKKKSHAIESMHQKRSRNGTKVPAHFYDIKSLIMEKYQM